MGSGIGGERVLRVINSVLWIRCVEYGLVDMLGLGYGEGLCGV